jgi:hypothetical protein
MAALLLAATSQLKMLPQVALHPADTISNM